MKNENLKKSVFLKRIFAMEFKSPLSIILVCCMLILPVLFMACEYKNIPGIIYNTDVVIDTTGRPTITGMTPASMAAGGVREINIVGSNLGLKNGTDTNWIYIGGVRPMIKDIQNSYITIYRPNLSNDHYGKTIYASVTDPNIMTVSSSFAYMMESPGEIVGDYTGIRALLAVDFDKSENLIMISNKTLYVVDFAGVSQTIVLNATNLLSANYTIVSDMSFGPGSNDNTLFMAYGRNTIARVFYHDTLNTTIRPTVLNVPAVVYQMDFDDIGNLYLAGNGVLYSADSTVGTRPTPVFTAITGNYTGGVAKKVRVVKESGSQYLYIADSLRIWKGLAGGAFNGTLVVDLATHPELSGCFITSFDIDANGSIFLCLKNHPAHSLFIREGNGSITPFYADSTILPNTVDKIEWGNSRYLYLISSALQSAPGTFVAGRVYRLNLDRNGAPYQGRTFIK